MEDRLYPSQMEMSEPEKAEYFEVIHRQNEELREQTELLRDMLDNQRRETWVWRGISILITVVSVGAQFL